MRVVAEFVKNDLSEDQLTPVVQSLVPSLLSILGDPQVRAQLSSRAGPFQRELMNPDTYLCYPRLDSRCLPFGSSDAGERERRTSTGRQVGY
jgi:hypothetical protein